MDFKPRLRRTFEAWLIAMAGSLRKRGIEFHVAISDAAVEWFPAEFSQQGGVLHLCRELRGRIEWKAAARLIQTVRPAGLSFCFYPMLSPITLGLTLLPGVRGTVFIDQSSSSPPQRTGIKQWLTHWRGMVGGRRYRRIITVSDYNAAKLCQRLGLPPNRVERIYNGIDLQRYLPNGALPELTAHSPFFFIGSIENFKGVPTLITAYKLLLARRPDAPPLWLAGGGRLLEALRSEVQANGLSAKIQLLGLRNDGPDLMMNARCLIIPSEWEEACAFVAIESMAAGRPAIISDAGSLPELFTGKATVFPKGQASALAAALEQTLDASTYATLATNAAALRKRAFETFSLERMVERYVSILAAACDVAPV